MKSNQKTVKSGAWFLIEVLGIFVLVQVIRYSIGNWNAVSIAFFLLSITLVLFISAFITARKKDNRNINKPTPDAFTGAMDP